MPYPTKPKGGWQRPRQVVVNESTAQVREKKVTQKFANKYKDIFQKTDSMAEDVPSSIHSKGNFFAEFIFAISFNALNANIANFVHFQKNLLSHVVICNFRNL